MRRSSVSIFVVGAGAALVLTSTLAATAWAHAAYRDSNPPDEGTVSSAPREIWAEYTEPPTDASYLEVFDPCGRQVDDGNSRADRTSNRVYIGMSGNTAGEYRVEWFVDSAVDAHSTRGEFTFTVTNGEPCPGAQVVEEDRKRDGSDRARDEDADTGDGGSQDDGGAVAAGSAGSGQVDAGQRSRTRHRDHRSQGTRDERNRNNRDGRQPAVAQPADAPNEETENDNTNIFTGIPIWGLAIALGFAAAIGAAGGFIYAGIMGYTRRA